MDSNCKRCGTYLRPEGAKFCFECGASTTVDTSLPPAQLTPNISAFLCYLFGIVGGIVFLNLEPYRHSALMRFHAWQSIAYSGLWFVVWILNGIPLLNYLWLFSLPVSFGLFLGWILLLVKAYNGEKFKLPILGDFAEKQAGN